MSNQSASARSAITEGNPDAGSLSVWALREPVAAPKLPRAISHAARGIIPTGLRAIADNAEPIDGLYAIGDCSGSVFSGNYPNLMHGFACGRTMTEAMHVVKQMTSA